MARRLLIAVVSALVAAAMGAMVNVATSRWDWTIASVLVATLVVAAMAQAVISHVERSDGEPAVSTVAQTDPGALTRDERWP